MLKSDFTSFKKRVANAESDARGKALQDTVLQFLRTYDDMELLCKEVKERKSREHTANDDIYAGF